MIKIFSNLDELNFYAAEMFVEIANAANEQNGKSAVALAGGSTPKSLYQLLAGEQFKDKVDWRKVFFFFGDERNVLPEDADSNFKMASESLFTPLQISTANVFRWQTELGNAEKIAEKYERTIKNFFDLREKRFPRFDLILLGMGEDGHTASLFPYTKALRETQKIAVANRVEKLETTRLTLTFPAINNSANVMFLVAGEKKAEVLRAVLEDKFEPEKFPSQNVKPENGGLFWLADEKAAQKLE